MRRGRAAPELKQSPAVGEANGSGGSKEIRKPLPFDLNLPPAVEYNADAEAYELQCCTALCL
nr:ethylene-responsive transcription factor 3-like [Ipomoea trifida]